jgi:hypothetical protein
MPNVQKCNDTLFVDEKFSYQHHRSITYRYTVDGTFFDTNIPLNAHINPDTVFEKSEGYIPNFAVPSQLIELKPQSKFICRVSNSANQLPRIVSFTFFFKKNISKENMGMMTGKIIPSVPLKK